MISSVSGRMPSHSITRPRVLLSGERTSTRSPSPMPIAAAAAAFITTLPWPATFPATSRISWMPTLPPQEYCMLRVEIPLEAGKRLHPEAVLAVPGEAVGLGAAGQLGGGGAAAGVPDRLDAV